MIKVTFLFELFEYEIYEFLSSGGIDNIMADLNDKNSEQNIILQLKEDGYYIEKIEKTPERCMIAVKQNGSALRVIPEDMHTYELCLQAVQQAGEAIKYVSKKIINEELCLIAVKNDGMALKLVPSKLKVEEVCRSAVQTNWKSFLYVPKAKCSVSICIAMLKSIITAFPNVDEITTEDYSYISKILKHMPESVNTDSQIIKLERQLGIIRFESKLYDKALKKFVVQEYCQYKEEREIKEFQSFIDFYDYLDGNLKDADLLDFNFEWIDLSTFNIEGAFISSSVLIAQNLYDDSFYNDNIRNYNCETELILSENNEVCKSCTALHEYDSGTKLNDNLRKIYYVSDIHIDYKLKKEFPRRASKQEIVIYIRKFIKHMLDTAKERTHDDYLLIGGDVSFNFEISSIFYDELAKQFKPKNIIAILGNNELWDFNKYGKVESCNKSVDDIIDKYRELFHSLGIHFLQNELFILNEMNLVVISEEQLRSLTMEELKNSCLKSSLVILGGIGFSGYNVEFNAVSGIYKDTVTSLSEDIEQTERFEDVYKIVNSALGDNRVIVLTHTPKENWNSDKYNSSWIYVNGHTHENSFCISDEKTVYSDNQIGYHAQNGGLKHFYLSANYDIFRYYQDGIYTISSEEYLDFNRGINVVTSFNRTNGSVRMLKKDGIYCFIFESDKTGRLYILNGGAVKKLEHNDLNYYFDRMVYYADAVKQAFKEYHTAIKSISNNIKLIGGTGTVHGCIVDIDFYDHVYLNPTDGTVTPYYAQSIDQKFTYDDISILLKKKRPDLYSNYEKLIQNNVGDTVMFNKSMNTDSIEMAEYVTETYMYEPSRIFKAVQYLVDNNVIRIWNESVVADYQDDSVDLENKLATGCSNFGLCRDS